MPRSLRERQLRDAFDRRRARAMEHKARPPARFSSLRSPKNTTIHPLEYAKTEKHLRRLMRTAIRSTRASAPLALPLAGALIAIALATPAQTAHEPPYTVTDVGANHRVWQRTVQVTNSATGEVTQQAQGYTELDAGMNYWTNNSAQAQGGWAESQDLIELTPTGAQAVHGQMKSVD